MKKSFMICVCCALMLPGVCLAQEALPKGFAPPESTIACASVGGQTTAGITIAVHDVSFDGRQLTLSITQAPNEAGVAVYEDEIANMSEDEVRAGLLFADGIQYDDPVIGSYCYLLVADEDGNEPEGSERASIIRDGDAIVETFDYRFPSREDLEALTVKVVYGVVETPGGADDAALNSLELKVPKREGDEHAAALSLPENMPEKCLAYCAVRGLKTEGVTFVVEEAHFDGQTLEIGVLQLPNDDSALVDNQVQYPPDDAHYINETQAALQYGKQILGTICDIVTITDETGHSLLKEYSVSSTGDGAAIINQFRIFLPPDNTAREINIEFTFGVNEDLRCRFDSSGSMRLSIPVLAPTAEIDESES